MRNIILEVFLEKGMKKVENFKYLKILIESSKINRFFIEQ